MTPSPKQITEQAAEIAELKTWKDAVLDSLAVSCGDCAIGTPPAEILKLVASINESISHEFHKAQIAEIMPLAKFGARVMRKFDTITRIDINQAALDENLYSVKELCVHPNIEATITKLLKD
jgi:hypothetical protein